MAKNVYISGMDAQSEIKKISLINRLASRFGFKFSRPDENRTSSSQELSNIKFVQKEINNLKKDNSAFGPDASKFSQKMEDLFDSWLSETTNSQTDLNMRTRRISELSFAYYNDPYISRGVNLAANEATQTDVQDILIDVKSPNPKLKARIYELFDQWGITQSRVRGAIRDIELFGDAFWTNKISERGVEKIMPLKQTQIKERLEYNPIEIAEREALKKGNLTQSINKKAALEELFNYLKKEYSFNESYVDVFESRLFGYILQDDIVLPPWSVTHFRNDADASEFFPFGRSNVISALAPFKQAASTMTLQSMARSLSFPLTINEVEVVPSMDLAAKFEAVNMVREAYENVGAVAGVGQSETYGINHKIWIPKGLVSTSIHKSEINADFIEDLKIYQERVAIAMGIPSSIFDPDFALGNVSAISLIEQHKPFARKVFGLQSSFLNGIDELLKIHFSISGEFDLDEEVFMLSMNFPGAESGSDRVDAKKRSMELASSVLEIFKDTIGTDDSEFPREIAKDILLKYSFLDPKDVEKWTSTFRTFSKNKPESKEDSGDKSENEDDFGGFSGGDDFDGGDFDGESYSDDDFDDSALEDEPTEMQDSYRKRQKRIREARRYKELKTRYNLIKEDTYFKTLDECQFRDFKNNNRHYVLSKAKPSYLEAIQLGWVENNFDTKPKAKTLKTLKEATNDIMADMADMKADAQTSIELNFENLEI